MQSSSHVDQLAELARELRDLKRAVGRIGIPGRTITAIGTRALRTGRRQTGEFPTNRASRWRLSPSHPQFGTEYDCKLIFMKLLIQLLEFDGAPEAPEIARALSRKYFDRDLSRDSYRDPFTRERLSYATFIEESANPRHGLSEFHIGHENPQQRPRHTPLNVNWRTARSNLLQGDMTLYEARGKFVELIARYFNLGEVRIEPEAE